MRSRKIDNNKVKQKLLWRKRRDCVAGGSLSKKRKRSVLNVCNDTTIYYILVERENKNQ